jgi:hypothetical protein
MNWKECERKWSWPNLRHYPRICLERQKKTTISQYSQSPGRVLNPEPPEYKAGMLTSEQLSLHLTISALAYVCFHIVHHVLYVVCLFWSTIFRDEEQGCGGKVPHILNLVFKKQEEKCIMRNFIRVRFTEYS